jgi:hypothetical protein
VVQYMLTHRYWCRSLDGLTLSSAMYKDASTSPAQILNWLIAAPNVRSSRTSSGASDFQHSQLEQAVAIKSLSNS